MDNPQKPPAKVKRTREEMQTTLENKKKVVANFRRSAFKKKKKVDEGRASSLGVKREHESTDLMAQKMMRGRMEPSAMPTMVHAIKQTTNSTTADISIGKTTEGAKAKDTTNDIATGGIVEGAEPRS